MLPSVSAAAPSVLATFDPPEGVNRQNSTYIARTLADKKQPLLAVLGLIPERGYRPERYLYIDARSSAARLPEYFDRAAPSWRPLCGACTGTADRRLSLLWLSAL